MAISTINFFRRKLAWELSISLAVIILCVCLLGAFFIYHVISKSFQEQLIVRANLASHSIQFSAESSNTLGGIQRFVAAMGAEPEFDSITIMAGDSLTVIASTKLASVGHSAESLLSATESAAVANVKKTKHTQYDFYDDTDKNGLRFLTPLNITGVLVDGKPLGAGVLYIAINTDNYFRDFKKFSLVMTAVMLTMSGIIFAALVVLFTVRVSRPQLKILEVLNRRKQGEKALCVVSGNNEITTLSETFNELFELTDEVDKLKSEFVSTVSHELRTPLTAIRGSLGIVLGAFGDQIPDKVLNLIGMASRNSEQLTLLINDLLDLEKMASGKLEFDFVETDLVEQLLQAKVRNDGYGERHEVSISVTNSLKRAPVLADVHRLQQVFANLLSNAIKFSEPKSSVSMNLSDAGDYYRVGIINKGRGIPEKFKKRIFQRFAQADSSDSREKGGTGLGLSIVKLIIEYHQGSIDFVSEENSYTEFFFFIPKLGFSPQSTAILP
ncbi:sensor histidine kinase [Cellvibrio sp.]|uniref:sensor histidine kinase n=1 Tax=Cellvibrio sp. TaxID=1965322 RepID=UPI0039647C6D